METSKVLTAKVEGPLGSFLPNCDGKGCLKWDSTLTCLGGQAYHLEENNHHHQSEPRFGRWTASTSQAFARQPLKNTYHLLTGYQKASSNLPVKEENHQHNKIENNPSYPSDPYNSRREEQVVVIEFLFGVPRNHFHDKEVLEQQHNLEPSSISCSS